MTPCPTSVKLCVSVTLHVEGAADPGLDNTVASVPGLRSIHHTRVRRLEPDHLALREYYWNGRTSPDKGDLFPNIGLVPDLEDMSSPLLDLEELRDLNLHSVSRKTSFSRCVNAFNASQTGELKRFGRVNLDCCRGHDRPGGG